MINQVWKEFAAHEVSHSVAHYLITLLELHERLGYARVSDVARELEVTKGSVSVQMKQLKEKGFVSEDENRFLLLTELGETEARRVIRTRLVFMEFLHTVLGLDRDLAEIDACKIEHLLSEEVTRQLLGLVELLHSDDPDARRLRKKLKDFEVECPTLEECPLCEEQCLVEVDPCRDRRPPKKAK